MTTFSPRERRALSIHLKPRAFGFVVLESPTTLIDWGVRATRRDKANQALTKIAELLHQYSPDILVLEDWESNHSRRCRRIEKLLNRIAKLAAQKGVRVKPVSIEKVHKGFASFGARTKYEIAHVVAILLPELAARLPRYREPWMSEDSRMAIFDAAALFLTYFKPWLDENAESPLPMPASKPGEFFPKTDVGFND